MEKVTTKKLALYSGRTHPELATDVAGHLGIELGHPNIVEFANGEVRPRFAESVRGNDVFTADQMDYDNLDRVMQLGGRVRGRLVPDRAKP